MPIILICTIPTLEGNVGCKMYLAHRQGVCWPHNGNSLVWRHNVSVLLW